MKSAYGKVFKDEYGDEFGIIRETNPPYPDELLGSNVLAEDESGNYFIEIAGEVLFWDHETNGQQVLSSTVNEFISGCEAPAKVELVPGQVESVWVDPEFAEKFGIKHKP